jgi:hypothetical protein
MDEQKDERDNDPDYGQGQGYAGEDGLHGSITTIKYWRSVL